MVINFERGKWYEWLDYHKNSKTGLRYFKYNYEKDKFNFMYSETIRVDGKHLFKKDYCGSSRMKECNISEILLFLPDNHPDRKNQINDVISNIVIW